MANAYLEASQGKAFGVLLLVFLGGAASGVLGTNIYERLTPPEEVVVAPAPNPTISQVAVQHLRDELSLDSGQMTRIQSVLDQCIMKQADMYLEFRNLQSEGREQILQILDKDQQEKFETLIHQASTQ